MRDNGYLYWVGYWGEVDGLKKLTGWNTQDLGLGFSNEEKGGVVGENEVQTLTSGMIPFLADQTSQKQEQLSWKKMNSYLDMLSFRCL